MEHDSSVNVMGTSGTRLLMLHERLHIHFKIWMKIFLLQFLIQCNFVYKFKKMAYCKYVRMSKLHICYAIKLTELENCYNVIFLLEKHIQWRYSRPTEWNGEGGEVSQFSTITFTLGRGSSTMLSTVISFWLLTPHFYCLGGGGVTCIVDWTVLRSLLCVKHIQL